MSAELPTLKDVYEVAQRVEEKFEEKLKDVPTRREMKLWIALGLVGGQTVASLITAYITSLSPPQQVHALADLALSLLH